VVAGYAIETPRLLLNSATSRFPDGLANRSGLVGKNLMVQSNQAVWGLMDEEIRSNKGPPSLAVTERLRAVICEAEVTNYPAIGSLPRCVSVIPPAIIQEARHRQANRKTMRQFLHRPRQGLP
jgi:hypothetical protein